MLLSQRQSQILELIKHGSSNKQIAERLGLTTGTVKQHVHALFRKLGVTNRTMAVSRADAMAASSETAASDSASKLPGDLRYSRRLVTVVVIEPRPGAARTPREATQINAGINLMRERIGRLAFAFDARSELLAGGGVAAWFGQPLAHGDDAERAIAFVRSLPDSGPAPDSVAYAIGVGTSPELVGEGERGATAYHRAFRIATQLASVSQCGAPLACAQTARLALLEPSSAVPQAPEGTTVIGPPSPANAAIARRWGGLPFLAELVAGLRERRCQWMSVESWPPEAGTRLMAAVAACLAAARVPVKRIWMPVPSGGNAVAQQLAWQLRQDASWSMEPFSVALAETLAESAAHGPAALFAYGIDALRVLEQTLGERGMERLRSLPLIIVAAAMQRRGTPQTVVRLLGSQPLASPFVRVLRLEVPAGDAIMPDGIRPDVQAVLDALSMEARAIARLAAHPHAPDVQAVAQALGLAEGEVIARCRELESWGLLWESGGRVKFRDDATAAAVRASLA